VARAVIDIVIIINKINRSLYAEHFTVKLLVQMIFHHRFTERLFSIVLTGETNVLSLTVDFIQNILR